jgi:hypothetical protein
MVNYFYPVIGLDYFEVTTGQIGSRGRYLYCGVAPRGRSIEQHVTILKSY